jgi:AraC-like DNA-binding protein
MNIPAGPWQEASKLTDLCDQYRATFGFALRQTDATGNIIGESPPHLDCACGGQSPTRRLQAAEQTRYWGETVINLCCDSGYGMWAVPVMNNNQLIGTLVVQGIDLELEQPGYHEAVQTAANALLQLALASNLMPQAEVTVACQRAVRERERFLAIEASKQYPPGDDIRAMYLTEEPALLSAIKGGAIQEARAILNRILITIYSLAGDRVELLKSSILELVVMMSRAAVEAGAEPATALGRNYRTLTELSEIEDEETLAEWVRRMLEALIECIRTSDTYPNSLLVLKAVKYMQTHLHQHLRRDAVARIAGLSPSHFSRLVTERMGRPFSQLLAQMRINRAKELLVQTDSSLSQIAMECGFFDQSHFNKLFRAATACAPGEYRRRARHDTMIR